MFLCVICVSILMRVFASVFMSVYLAVFGWVYMTVCLQLCMCVSLCWSVLSSVCPYSMWVWVHQCASVRACVAQQHKPISYGESAEMSARGTSHDMSPCVTVSCAPAAGVKPAHISTLQVRGLRDAGQWLVARWLSVAEIKDTISLSLQGTSGATVQRPRGAIWEHLHAVYTIR
jgi:hypothetical protein